MMLELSETEDEVSLDNYLCMVAARKQLKMLRQNCI